MIIVESFKTASSRFAFAWLTYTVFFYHRVLPSCLGSASRRELGKGKMTIWVLTGRLGISDKVGE